VIDFIAELDPRARKRLLYTLERLAQTGWAGPGETVVKRLEAEVYEIREHVSNSRVFCFFEGRRVVVCTHARRKPAGRSRYRDETDKVKSWRGRCIAEGILP
jgi:phage-related protein